MGKRVPCRAQCSPLQNESGTPVSHHEFTSVSFNRRIAVGKEYTYLEECIKL